VTDEEENDPAAAPHVAVSGRPRVPLVWAIPVVAALIALFLAWRTYSTMGPTITITFQSANGLEAGKTPIKYRSVPLGIVKTVTLSDDLSHVIVTAQMDKTAQGHLRAGTTFWIESAQLTASGVTGLSTLVSGVYIGMLPGPGEERREFEGVLTPPVLAMNVPGKTFHLHADRLASIGAAAPIYFRGIQVGEVLGYTLDADGKGVTIFAFVRAPHDDLVRDKTSFWNASGIDVSLAANGLKVRTQSLVSILVGGIAFDTPVDASAGEPSQQGALFPLYESFESIEQAQFAERVPFLLRFDGSAGGLAPGSPVVLRGIQIGVVRSVSLEVDVEDVTVQLPVIIEIEPQRVTLIGRRADMTPQQRVAEFVEKGLRARLESGNLLTGSLVVSLDFVKGAPPAKVEYENGYPVIPTVPSEIQQLKEQATAFVQKLAKAPVAELVADLRTTVQDVDRVLGSKKIQEGLPELVQNLNRTLDTARGTLAQAETTLASAGEVLGPDSALRYDLVRLIKELTATARSLRALADFLERDPDALIFGKEKAASP